VLCYERRVTDVLRGRLRHAGSAPPTGERTETIVRARNLVVEQVLSGAIEPRGYLQPEDEWALVLEGAATLDVEGEAVELGAGDWVFLPSGTPHRLVRTEPGTNWLTVKLGPDDRP